MYKRTYIWGSKSWHAYPGDRYITLEFRDEDDDSFGEITVKWVELGWTLTPEISFFDDSWMVVASLGDLFEKLADFHGLSISEEKFVAILEECGFKDDTPYKSPYSDKETSLRRELDEAIANVKRLQAEITRLRT